MASNKKAVGAIKPPLCILGTAPSLEQAPFDDDTYEMWGVSTVQTKDACKRVDRLFEMHPRRYWGDYRVMERLNTAEVPIYMQAHNPDIPQSVPYPYEAIREEFYHPVMKDNLFVTNTITWMLLLAIHEGYTDISLYGVHMAHETEYGYQQASCSWAIGIIHGFMLQGLPYRLHIADDSQLMTARYEYGYGEPTRQMQYVKKRADGLKKGLGEVDKQIESLQRKRYLTEGAAIEAENLFNHLAGFK